MAVIEITQAEYDKKFGDGSNKGSEPIEITQADYDAKFGKSAGNGKIWDEGNAKGADDKFGFFGMPKTLDTWKDVGEGALIASDTPVTEAVTDLTLGAGAGVNDLMASVSDYFGGDDNKVSEFFRTGSRLLRDKMYTKDGVADAVGSEVGSMAVSGPAGGKAVDLLLGSGKIVGNAVKRQVGRKSQQAIDDQVARSNRVSDRVKSGKGTKDTDELNAELNAFQKGFERNTKSPKSPQIGIISETIGKLSPTAEKIIDKYYSKILSPISKSAATENRFGFIKEMMENGYSNRQAVAAWSKLTNPQSAGKTATDALFKSPSKTGSAVGALFGSGTESKDGNIITFPDGSTARRR